MPAQQRFQRARGKDRERSARHILIEHGENEFEGFIRRVVAEVPDLFHNPGQVFAQSSGLRRLLHRQPTGGEPSPVFQIHRHRSSVRLARA
jgi:hypothetical protein